MQEKKNEQIAAAELAASYPYQGLSYFMGLNSVRFIAAFLVILHHGESMKLKNGFAYLGGLGLFHNGTNAVTLFLVLSGFLLTFFLLKERKATGSTNVSRFYTKRVLRIFPLYFLLVLFGTLAMPYAVQYLGVDYDIPYTFGDSWYFYLLFVPALVTFYYGHHLLEPLWSIGVEVFFYTIWAPLFKVAKRSILPLILTVIGLRIALLALALWGDMPAVYTFLIKTYSLESMAIGALGAYLIYFAKTDFTKLWLFDRKMQIAVFALVGTFLFFNTNIDHPLWNFLFKTPILTSILLSFLFLYIILAISLPKVGLFKTESKTFWYFGEISYGIYMYHTTVIAVVIVLFKKLPLALSPSLANLLFYVAVIGGTLLVSHLSKKYFENYFLRLLKRG